MSFRFSYHAPANPANPAKPRADADDAPSQPAAKAANVANASHLSDDLVRCPECLQLATSGVCLAAGPGKPVVAARGYTPIQHMHRRCEGFTPHPNNPDQRLGHERWPALLRFHESDPSFGSHAMPPGATVAP